VLTAEENERLMRVGPGTPGGEFLRRYWYPMAVARELTDEHPTKFVRLLGEDLVLFRDKSGRVGLVADHCPHRGASLLYGRVEERGIACAYHGWLYDIEGNCLETPAEPADSKLYLTVKHRAYPVQKLMGLYWAYLGPLPAPVIPHYDVWFRQDGCRTLEIQPVIDCNWFQATENSVDPAHAQILHQEVMARGRGPRPGTTRGFIDEIAATEFWEYPHGIMKRRTFKSGQVDEHPILFPSILRVQNSSEIRVPIDDTHMRIYEPYFVPSPDGSLIQDDEPEIKYLPPFKEPQDQSHPFTRFHFDTVANQDAAAWETQGPMADRTRERLGSSDQGVVLLRKVLLEQIERVQQGLDPLAVERDPSHPIIDTHLDASIALMRQRWTRTQVASAT
jgi:5,5'-dehydrodivanillate O-demethylase